MERRHLFGDAPARHVHALQRLLGVHEERHHDEDPAPGLAHAYPLDIEWIRVRKAGRRVFVMVSFFVDPKESLEGMDVARRGVAEEMTSLHPDVDVAVLFSSAPAKS